MDCPECEGTGQTFGSAINKPACSNCGGIGSICASCGDAVCSQCIAEDCMKAFNEQQGTSYTNATWNEDIEKQPMPAYYFNLGYQTAIVKTQ